MPTAARFKSSRHLTTRWSMRPSERLQEAMVELAGDRGSSPPLEKGYPEKADANFITSSRNPDRMATFPDRRDATGRTSLLYGAGDPHQDVRRSDLHTLSVAGRTV